MPPVRSFGIAAKLSLLSLTFALPTAYLLWLLVSQQQIAIDFAAREAAGARALAALIPVQAEVAQAALARQPGTSAAARLRTADPTTFVHVGVNTKFNAALAGLEAAHDAAGLARARSTLRELIAQSGDRSNLILDNVLESYYLIDLTLTHLPDVLDRVTELGMDAVEARSIVTLA